MNKEIKNLPASVHDRLKRLAKGRERPFVELFYYYSIERFLYRFSQSPYANSFDLKGGLMFMGWGIQLRRPTRDIDFQGYAINTIQNMESLVKEICDLDVEPDGMRFDSDSVSGEQIIDAADYHGIRIYFTGYLGRASIHLHLDVSFANVITPQEIVFDYPTLLEMPGFKIRGYPYETAIAEKFQAMVVLDNINDRMKDFYDIWLLTQQVDINGKTLVTAVQATFRTRNTPLPRSLPIALTEKFGQQRQLDWERFLKRSILEVAEHPSFSEIISTVRNFIWPIVEAARNNMTFDHTWRAGGPWQSI